MTMVESAHRTLLRDQRADAIRVLEDQYERLQDAAARCELFAAATQGVRDQMAESLGRLRSWCTGLFGPDAPVVDEHCTCFMCGWVEDGCDPFAEGDDSPAGEA